MPSFLRGEVVCCLSAFVIVVLPGCRSRERVSSNAHVPRAALSPELGSPSHSRTETMPPAVPPQPAPPSRPPLPRPAPEADPKDPPLPDMTQSTGHRLFESVRLRRKPDTPDDWTHTASARRLSHGHSLFAK